METLSIARARLRHRPPTGGPFVYLNAALSADGKLALVTKGKVLSDHGDAYAAQCKI